MAICGKMKSRQQWVTRDKSFNACNGSCGKAAANISHFSKSKTHDMIKKPCLSTREKQAFLIPIIPTRSCQKFSKQICLWNLAQGIGIIFIIQIVGAI